MKSITYHGIEFNIIKTNGGYKAETRRYHLLACTAVTQKETIRLLEAQCSTVTETQLHEMLETGRLHKIKNRFFNDARIRRLFVDTFHFELSAASDRLLSKLTGYHGIDVIRLDALLHVPDGISTSQFIIQNYGIRAEKLIKKLI